MKNQLNWKLLGLAVMMMFSPLFGAGQVNLDSGLVAYYPFNGNADDESGNGLNGIVSGALLTQDRFGRDNHAYYFDNINDYIQIANSNNVFNLIGSWAISLWIHPYSISGTSAANDPILWKIAYNNTNQDNYAILWNNNFDGTAKIGGQIERASDDHDFGFGGGTFTEKQDYHVLVNVGNDSITLIVNGDSVSARALPTNLVPYMGPAPLRIGNNQHSNHGDKGVFHGVIDDIRIYHRSLTKEEIYALYNESGNSTPISE
ncbi:MAG: LamG domain-containing protein, partial [Bacteroidetes bacterium]|nr:LamG domain-containing protein [Bacteroidota bacterium]